MDTIYKVRICYEDNPFTYDGLLDSEESMHNFIIKHGRNTNIGIDNDLFIRAEDIIDSIHYYINDDEDSAGFDWDDIENWDLDDFVSDYGITRRNAKRLFELYNNEEIYSHMLSDLQHSDTWNCDLDKFATALNIIYPNSNYCVTTIGSLCRSEERAKLLYDKNSELDVDYIQALYFGCIYAIDLFEYSEEDKEEEFIDSANVTETALNKIYIYNPQKLIKTLNEMLGTNELTLDNTCVLRFGEWVYNKELAEKFGISSS